MNTNVYYFQYSRYKYSICWISKVELKKYKFFDDYQDWVNSFLMIRISQHLLLFVVSNLLS